MAKYFRLCTNVKDRGVLITEAELEKETNDLNRELYLSTYYYNDQHYKQFKNSGSIAGIRDVKTNKLWFDFDHEVDPNLAKTDAITVVDRLIAARVPEKNIEVYFSGRKGFDVRVTLKNRELTPEQVKSLIINKFGKDLTTLDTSMYDATQILRVPGSKHQKSGLVKIPLTTKELRTLTLDDIRKKATSLDNINEDFNWDLTEVDDGFLDVPVKVEEKKKVSPPSMDTPAKNWKDYRWALLQGHFGYPGKRHDALLRLTATLRAMGYDQDTATFMCLAADAKHCAMTGDHPVDDLEDDIIPSVYSDTWQGGQYSPQTDPWLQEYCQRMGFEYKKSDAIRIGDLKDDFFEYVNHIEENTILTGIPKLDKAMPLTIGMNLGVVGAASSGKCLGKDTPVLMFDGTIKKVQDVKVGDKLMGDDSTPRTVLSTCTGREKMYRIEQENGDDYIVNESHILSLRTNHNKKKNSRIKKGNIIDINVKDFLNESNTIKRYFKGFKVGVEFQQKEVPLDPYFIGLWLGDGDSNNQTITTSDQPIIDYLREYSSKFEKHTLHQYQDLRSKAIDVTIVNQKNEKNLVLEHLRGLELIKNKHIPKQYLLNNRTNRLKLLAGLIDSDGHWSNSRHYEITLKNNTLATDVVFLCRSLGFKTTISKEKKGCLYKGIYQEGEYNRIYINGKGLKEIPVLLERKKATSEPSREVLNTKIKIVELPEDNYYGFEIDGNHRFLLGDFTVTHNTALALNILKNTSEKGVISVFASLDMHRNRLFEKLLYKETKLSREELYEKIKKKQLGQVFEKIKKDYENVYFYDRSCPSVKDIRSYIQEVEEKTGKKVKLVMIDYFERVNSDKSEDTAASKDVAGQIQDLINDFNVCVITLVQPNKFALSGGPDTPIKSYTAIKGSSFLYQSFRSIISIWRPFFTPEWKDYDHYLQMAILKNDLGELDLFTFGWEGKTGRISEIAFEEFEEFKRLLEKKKENEEKEQGNDSWK